MSILGKFWFPAAVVGLAIAGTLAGSTPTHKTFDLVANAPDTVIYPKAAYKLNRKGGMEDIALSDSLLKAMQGSFGQAEDDDTLHLSARDTIHAPDSLRETDPFRYKYYVALLDSAVHAETMDSLRLSQNRHWEELDTLSARRDSLDMHLLDSIYTTEAAIRKKEAFEAWYNGLSPEARKRYDYEQSMNRKKAISDSLLAIREEKKAVRDSIRQNTPRVLETFALPEDMQYKRIVAWQLDPDFQHLDAYVPDTSYNYYFNDYAFRRKDVNSSWLGVAGSPVQPFNFFERKSSSGVDFYTPNEAWTFSHESLPNYNTKTPYTELAYWGSILAASAKESDNIHVLTTQNITPEFNFQLLYDRWGGGGMLDNEETKNKTFSLSGNYIGKKYMAHAGFISNTVGREENGGLVDSYWVRDTTVDSREIAVHLTNASSNIKKRTLYLDQQYRIPLTFVQDLFSRKTADTVEFREAADTTSGGFAPEDTASVAGAEPPKGSLLRDVTSAFIGHSTEWSSYGREYYDYISDSYGRSLYDGVFNYSGYSSADTLKMTQFDNKLFVRLQPWRDDGFVSKLNVGIGDKFRSYRESYYDTTRTADVHRENSLYAYAGVEGNISKYFSWDAKGRLTFAGAELGDFSLNANARLKVYPFRRARTSPLTLGGRFETTLQEPQWYQKHIYTNHFSWDNDFGKTSTSKIEGYVDIPYLKADARVGYALIANNIYYDTLGVIRQEPSPISVLSASLRKEFVIARFLHLDNRVLFQASSNPGVLPLPRLSVNLRWYAQFVAQRNEEKTADVLTIQIGLNGWYNTAWYAPAWNPNLGVFHNQNSALYNGGPVVDAFINMQWKRACIFLKFENANMGWPFDRADYLSAHNFINTQRVFKVGIFWPFYMSPGKDTPSGGAVSSTNPGTRRGTGGASAGRRAPTQ